MSSENEPNISILISGSITAYMSSENGALNLHIFTYFIVEHTVRRKNILYLFIEVISGSKVGICFS